MSHSHIRQAKPPAAPSLVWWHFALPLAAVLVLLGFVYLISNWIHSFPSAYETANAEVLETRKVVEGTIDSRYGGKILYRFEAHVHYVVDGRMQDRWLRISDDPTRDAVLLKLAGHPTQCVAYWPPKFPENARCLLR
jgi:hypothetical protein